MISLLINMFYCLFLGLSILEASSFLTSVQIECYDKAMVMRAYDNIAGRLFDT